MAGQFFKGKIEACPAKLAELYARISVAWAHWQTMPGRPSDWEGQLLKNEQSKAKHL